MENIDLYSSFFNNCYKIVVENGSKDNTKIFLTNIKAKTTLFLSERTYLNILIEEKD